MSDNLDNLRDDRSGEDAARSVATRSYGADFVMDRKAAIAWGVVDGWPRDAALKVGDHRAPAGFRFVTWKEMHRHRQQRDQERLAFKRRIDEPSVRPCCLWTFDNGPIVPYGGWWCYLVMLNDQIGVNFRGLNKELALSIMQAVPCGLLPLLENFDHWMEAFAEQHPRNHPKDPRRAGSIVGWLKGRTRFALQREFVPVTA